MKSSILSSILAVCLTAAITQATEIPAGPVSGQWYASGNPYNINGDIFIPIDSSLFIHEGVEVVFLGYDYSLTIYGLLQALGTVQDSISFTTDLSYWNSLRFIDASSFNNLVCCNIQKGCAAGDSIIVCGGGIYCHNSNLSISHSTISGNWSVSNGAGIFADSSNISISECLINSNSAGNFFSSANGGGIYLVDCNSFLINCNVNSNSCYQGIGCGIVISNGYAILENCSIVGNSGGVFGVYCSNCNADKLNCIISNNSGGGICFVNSNSNIENCAISQNAGSGISCNSSDLIITGSTISQNAAGTGVGGGIYCGGNSNPILNNCVISENSGWWGGGIRIDDSSSPIFSHCRIVGNSAGLPGGGIYCLGPTAPIFVNCIISDNTCGQWQAGGIYIEGASPGYPVFSNCVISNNGTEMGGYGGGILCWSSSPTIINTIFANNNSNGCVYMIWSEPIISYCDFYNNQGGNFGGVMPPEIGIINSINFNGDSCDAFFNLFEDPLFIPDSLDPYHLSSSSPCIDAGNPDSLDPEDPLNPGFALWPALGTTISDMGAYGGSGANGWSGVVNEQSYSGSVPVSFGLQQNYPNPFNPTTTIPFNLPKAAWVSLKVYDTCGRLVETLVEGWRIQGNHQLTWDAGDLPSGIYFARLLAGDFSQTQKMVLLK